MDSMPFFSLFLVIPLSVFGLIFLFLRKDARLAQSVSLLGSLMLALCALYKARYPISMPADLSMPWFQLGRLSFDLGYAIDVQSVLMLLVVCVLSFWIHLFSVGYLKKDPSKGRYFGSLSLFIFAMLGIVLANNLILMFIFWELVGLGSYLLIAHYWTTDKAAQASKKAFIVNRVGDFGFLLGIIGCQYVWGTTHLASLNALVQESGVTPPVGLGLLLMCGFLGKSAQFPLHVWLPDAMAGPTPVSALIHAATMVAAGIYFLCRTAFLYSPEVLDLILWIGAGMSLYAAVCAIGQRDIKKVLAYSTLSQLGYMAAAFGLGFSGLALFHLTTHAFFKALLFLGAGAVISQLHPIQDLGQMGGLIKRMPVTAASFLIGVLALSGVPFLSGYFSKDAIIEAAFLNNTGAFILLTLAALFTAFYSSQLFLSVFLGKARSPEAKDSKEAGLFMLLPLIVLSCGAVFAAYAFSWPEFIYTLFDEDIQVVKQALIDGGYDKLPYALSLTWILGFGAAFGMRKRFESQGDGERSVLMQALRKGLFVDTLYTFYVQRVQAPIVNFFRLAEFVLFSAVINEGGGSLFRLAGGCMKYCHEARLQPILFGFLSGFVSAIVVALIIF